MDLFNETKTQIKRAESWKCKLLHPKKDEDSDVCDGGRGGGCRGRVTRLLRGVGASRRI